MGVLFTDKEAVEESLCNKMELFNSRGTIEAPSKVVARHLKTCFCKKEEKSYTSPEI